MSEHCQYVVFPSDGRQPFVVESHPFPSMISDDLEGAVAEAAVVMPAAGCAMWIREDAATTGHQRNLVASVIATSINNWRRPTLVVGPAVLTNLIMTGVHSASGMIRAEAEGFSSTVAQALATVAADVKQAIAGSDGPFQTRGLPPNWAVKVRSFADRLATLPISDDWPVSENQPLPYDHISAALERRYPGTQFVPFEVGPAH